jgi:hypothetical protein
VLGLTGTVGTLVLGGAESAVEVGLGGAAEFALGGTTSTGFIVAGVAGATVVGAIVLGGAAFGFSLMPSPC